MCVVVFFIHTFYLTIKYQPVNFKWQSVYLYTSRFIISIKSVLHLFLFAVKLLAAYNPKIITFFFQKISLEIFHRNMIN